MSDLYDRYRQGAYQAVYDELLAMQEHIYDPSISEEARLVMRETMRRVGFNIELLIARLQEMGYRFGEGFAESPEEEAYWKQHAPIYQAPTPETPEHIARLERLTGSLPLSLKCWYEEVGTVNLIGLFPSHKRADGPLLDPLFIYSVEMAVTMVNYYINAGVWHRDPTLSLAPDHYHKYGFSGAGTYALRLPCKALDGPLLLERHHTTFVNYLRICLRWGGFPGLAAENRLSPGEMDFLTKDLLLF